MLTVTHHITAIVVNWFSGPFLHHLIPVLIRRARHPGALQFMIVDNTFGRDPDLDRYRTDASAAAGRSAEYPPIKILVPESHNLTGSRAHARALALAAAQVTTPYTLVIDPDVHVFADGWDALLIERMEHTGALAAGAPYPFWKLGKYHDFPSPVFNLFRTNDIRALAPDWSPFGSGPVQQIGHFIGRQIVRMGLLATRRRVTYLPFFRGTGRWLESVLGVCGPDTGWRIAARVRQTGQRVLLFRELIRDDPVITSAPDSDTLAAMADEFECYAFGDRLFMAHKYGTHSLLWRTPRGRDTEYWFKTVRRLETVCDR